MVWHAILKPSQASAIAHILSVTTVFIVMWLHTYAVYTCPLQHSVVVL
jgi:hypothetical protein